MGKIEIPIRLIQTAAAPDDLVMGPAASLVGFLNDLQKPLSCRQSEVRHKMMAERRCFTDLMIVSVCHYLRLTSRVMSVTYRDTF